MGDQAGRGRGRALMEALKKSKLMSSPTTSADVSPKESPASSVVAASSSSLVRCALHLLYVHRHL